MSKVRWSFRKQYHWLKNTHTNQLSDDPTSGYYLHFFRCFWTSRMPAIMCCRHPCRRERTLLSTCRIGYGRRVWHRHTRCTAACRSSGQKRGRFGNIFRIFGILKLLSLLRRIGNNVLPPPGWQNVICLAGVIILVNLDDWSSPSIRGRVSEDGVSRWSEFQNTSVDRTPGRFAGQPPRLRWSPIGYCTSSLE